MSLTIVARADLRTDGLIVLVATVGGLVIEAWGTQTNLWFYYTSERPPLWIIPAWPIATLSIDRITRALSYFLPKEGKRVYQVFYGLTFVSFYVLMLIFVAPTFDKPYTILALLLCALLIITSIDHRLAFLVFVAGVGLGYFLELWGTTRRVLDLLYLSNAAIICSGGTRYGRSRFLAHGINPEKDRDEIRLVKATTTQAEREAWLVILIPTLDPLTTGISHSVSHDRQVTAPLAISLVKDDCRNGYSQYLTRLPKVGSFLPYTRR